MPAHLFQHYEILMDKADQAFKKIAKEYLECIRCKRHCSDCCHAVFGLFLVEAAYLQKYFNQLGRKERRAAILRGKKADRGLQKIEKRPQAQHDDPRTAGYALERARIRCPLLDDNKECVLYSHRPITCRVYGIPTAIQGKAHVCGKTGFKSGQSYPVFNLDEVQRELFYLSRDILQRARRGNAQKASLLISVSKTIETPLEDIIQESFAGSVAAY